MLNTRSNILRLKVNTLLLLYSGGNVIQKPKLNNNVDNQKGNISNIFKMFINKAKNILSKICALL